MRCGLFFLVLASMMNPAYGVCDFRPPLVNQVAVGAIAPTQVGNVVASITLRFQCTQGDTPAFSLIGSNDTGPGLHRMRNLNNPSRYLPYRATTGLTNPTRYVITITVTEADYRDAWIGPYRDTLIVTIAP